MAGRIGMEKMKIVAFADDVIVWGEREEDVQEQLNAEVIYGARNRMSL